MPSDVRDKPYSWVVAVAASVMFFIMYGLARITGQLFVETLTFFDTDRETASFPFTLSCALRYLSGPLAGALAGRLGLRTIIFIGSAMACIGVGGCYMATSITAISFFFGGLFGLGSGISSSQIPQLINLYFAKHLTTANGISYGGAAVAGFVLPPIMECLLYQYEISGTYLLLTGLALHAFPATILLKEPETEKLPMISFEIPEEIRENYRRRVSDLSIMYDNTKRRLSGATTQTKTRNNMEINSTLDKVNSSSTRRKSSYFSSHSNGSSIKGKSITFSRGENILQNVNASQEPSYSNMQNILLYSSGSLSEIREGEPWKNTRSAKVESKYFSNSEVTFQTLNMPQDAIAINLQTSAPFRKKSTGSLLEIKENELLETKDIVRSGDWSEPPISIISRHPSICSRNSSTFEKGITPEQPPNMCLNDISIFWDLKFFLVCFTGSINGFFCFVIPTILIDFSMDKGISMTDATNIMVAFSVFDLVGRVGLGWVTDAKYMSRANFCAVCFFVMAACLALFVLLNGLIPMFLILSVLGLVLGAHTPLPTGLIVEYIEESKHTMANASFEILAVPFLLWTPSMIGYFRDGLGSYDMFVYILGIISFVSGLMMFLLPFIQRREQEKKFLS